MTDAELDALDRLCQQATPGPWFTVEGTGISADGLQEDEEWGLAYGLLADTDTHSAIHPEQDAAFIAAARTALPQLVAEVRRLKERTQELEGKIGTWQRARHDLNQWLTAQPYREQFNRETPRHIQAEAMLLQVKVPE